MEEAGRRSILGGSAVLGKFRTFALVFKTSDYGKGICFLG